MMIHQLRSLENPRTSLADFDQYDGSSYTADTGERIDRAKALQYSPVFKALTLISGDVAKLGCFVYARVGQGKDRATDHPAYQLLRYAPNPDTTAFRFYQTVQGHACEGNGYAYIDRAPDGRPLALYPLNPDNVTPVRYGGEMFYIYESATVKRVALPAADVLHIAGLGFDGLIGYSIWEYGRNSIGMGRASQKYVNRFFANNARPGIVLEVPGKLEAARAQQLLATWNATHGGMDRAQKAALITDGMKIQTIASAARDNQLVEGMQFSVRDVANWFRIPPHKLGDTTRTSFSSLEQENQSYLDEALDPWLVQWEQECWSKLLTEDEKRADSHVIEFNRKALLRADMATRGEFYLKATGGRAWLTPDEVRGTENLNPAGGDAAELKDPTNNFGGDAGTASPASASPDPEPSPSEDSDRAIQAADAVTRDATKRAVTRLANQASRAAKSGPDVRAFIAALASETAAVADILAPAAALRASLGMPVGADAAALTETLAASLTPCLSQSTRDIKPAVETAIELWRKGVLL